MKLINILQERKSIPRAEKVHSSVLREYIFKDWQTFNQKVVPSFKVLRGRIMKENYNGNIAKNNLMGVVDFAAKKYVAECTDRKYLWNEMFPKNERLKVVNEILYFFERYNLNSKTGLLTEEDSSNIREATIIFSDLEVEMRNGQPKLVLNFDYDKSTINFISRVLASGKDVKLTDSDFELLKSFLKVDVIDISGGKKMSYLKFEVTGGKMSGADLKVVTGGSFHYPVVKLEIIGAENPEQKPQTSVSIDNTNTQNNLSDNEIQEIVNESIKKYKNFIRS